MQQQPQQKTSVPKTVTVSKNNAKIPNPAKVKKSRGILKFFIGLLIGILAPVIALGAFIVVNDGSLITFVRDFDFDILSEPIIEIAAGEMSSEEDIDLTIETFDLLKTGMSYKDVTKIIGGKGTVLRKSGTRTEYGWTDPADSEMTITIIFERNKLSTKSQTGLD